MEVYRCSDKLQSGKFLGDTMIPVMYCVQIGGLVRCVGFYRESYFIGPNYQGKNETGS